LKPANRATFHGPSQKQMKCVEMAALNPLYVCTRLRPFHPQKENTRKTYRRF
jgi:hypothetical protein